MNNYKIIKCYRRNEETGSIGHFYIIKKEVIIKGLPLIGKDKKVWEAVGELIYGHYKIMPKIFNTLKEAKQYLKNLKKPLPPDEEYHV